VDVIICAVVIALRTRATKIPSLVNIMFVVIDVDLILNLFAFWYNLACF